MFLMTAPTAGRMALTASKMLRMRTASSALMATSVPAPMAMPKSALAKSRGIIDKSPIMATSWPSAWEGSDVFPSLRRDAGNDWGWWRRWRMKLAMRWLSPVAADMTLIPILASRQWLPALVLFDISGGDDADDFFSPAKGAGILPSAKVLSWP